MELRDPQPLRQPIAAPDQVRPHLARDRLFCPDNLQEVPDGAISRVTETWDPENVDPRHTLH
jgi:hypothetical protein